jgi:hypothetical protein
MRATRSLAVLGVSALSVTVLAVTPVAAQQSPTMAMSPNQGAPGSGFKVGWSGFTFGADCKDTTVQVLWDGQTQIGSGPTTRGIGSAGASVPGGAAAGGHLVVADAVCGNSIARGIFTVVVPPPTTTVPPPTTNPPVTTIPPVTTQPPNTTKPPGVPTTTPPTTADPSSSVPPSSSSNSSVPVGVHSGTEGALTLDKDNIQPGDPLTATGTGCAPGSEVRLSSLNESVGTARADSTGRFSAPVEFATIQPGRHTIRAQCDIVLLGSVDVALTTSAAGGTTSTLVVLLFFLLIGATMLRRQFSALRIPAKTR